jgi:hypothetical protein
MWRRGGLDEGLKIFKMRKMIVHRSVGLDVFVNTIRSVGWFVRMGE